MIKGWSFAKIITLPIPDANLTDFPVEVPIVADADIGAECLATGYDIRFTAADSITLLPYERESFAVASGEATGIFWVKTDVATAGTYLWLYYGNSAAADGADPENVWDTDFKAVYHMNDATTSTILDSTGNDRDGTKKDVAYPNEVDGKIARGQNFDGSYGAISVAPISASFYVLEFCVKSTTNATGNQRILTPSDDHWILWRAGDSMGLGFYGTTLFSPDSLALNEWEFYSIVYNRSTGDGTIYKNGSLAATGNAARALPTGNWIIGHNESINYNVEGFPGIMDEVRISTAIRSPEWIAYEYANMNPADGGLTWGAEKNVKSAVHSFFES
jgi:hypothetical protein